MIIIKIIEVIKGFEVIGLLCIIIVMGNKIVLFYDLKKKNLY